VEKGVRQKMSYSDEENPIDNYENFLSLRKDADPGIAEVDFP